MKDWKFFLIIFSSFYLLPWTVLCLGSPTALKKATARVGKLTNERHWVPGYSKRKNEHFVSPFGIPKQRERNIMNFYWLFWLRLIYFLGIHIVNRKLYYSFSRPFFFFFFFVPKDKTILCKLCGLRKMWNKFENWKKLKYSYTSVRLFYA